MRKKNNRITVRVSDATAELLKYLSEKSGRTQTEIIEDAIYEYGASGKIKGGTPFPSPASTAKGEGTEIYYEGVQQSAASAASLAEHIDKILLILGKLDKNSFHQLNLLNSLCDNIVEPNRLTYSSAEQKPTEWLSSSKDELHHKLIRQKTENI